MKNISKFSLVLLAGLAWSASSARAAAPLRRDLEIAVLLQVSDADGNVPSSADTALYDKRKCNPGDSLTPIIAPDGHHVMWGEWAAADGQAAVKCVKKGSHVVVHLSGLIPNGQYTAWIPVFKAPGYNPATFPENVVAAGALGLQEAAKTASSPTITARGKFPPFCRSVC